MAKIGPDMRGRLSIHLEAVAREIQSDLQEREAFGIQDLTPPHSPNAPTAPQQENTMTPSERKTLFFVFKEAMIGLVACIKACNKKPMADTETAVEDQLKEPAPVVAPTAVRVPTPYPPDAMAKRDKEPESGSPVPRPYGSNL